MFADAAAALPDFGPDAPSPLAWLYTVAQRRVADEARRRGREPEAAAEPVEYPEELTGTLVAAFGRLPGDQLHRAGLKLIRGARCVGRFDGRVISHGSGTGDLGTEPFLLSDIYRQALEQGKLHETGRTTIRGREAIVVEAPQPHGGSVRAYLDAKTYRLLRIQFLLGGKVASQTDVLTFETVSREQAQLPKPTPGAAPRSGSLAVGSGSSASVGRVNLASARSAFASIPMWAGRGVDGHGLTSVSLEHVTDNEAGGGQTSGKKLVLDYGESGQSLDVGEAYLEIEEAPSSSPLWEAESVYTPPPGYVDVLGGQESSSNTGDRTRWGGVMQQDGFVIQLASWSRDTLFAAARALQPLP